MSSDPESAAMHRELAPGARRFALRYDPAYWRCPVCGNGATNIEPWVGVYWAWCEHCWTRGVVGVNIVDPLPTRDADGQPFPETDLIQHGPIDPEILAQFRYEWILSLASFHDLTRPIPSTPAHQLKHGEPQPMKTTMRTITIKIPASSAVLTDGLELRTVSPGLIDAERELADASEQLRGLREDLQQRADRVALLAVGDDAVAHSREFHQWQAAKARVPLVEGRLKRADAALAEARQTATAAAMAEARDRHAVLLAAAATLAAELKAIQALEDELNARVANLPSVPGAGMNYIGGVRDVALVTA